ncbi:DMT family transporter [Pseudemcibacter aquimaris]|uniref:DMT family transporter n=1 Tax=Pseudemcibacter aquimaris TaxID=2857064 RepID=UPI0020119B42|nr:EamA family transporter [Pseudemcibacter aquimaris]MCC3861383.1 EamA family transporter [Pseudemcibacter aquimaris]WDU58153.1 EamA family transporter [Pseudemcibacter aquimaris]
MQIRYALFALFVCFIWGVNFAVMKIGLMQLDPYLFGLLRFSIVFLLLLPWLKVVPGEMIKLFILGNLIGGFQFALIFLGMDLTNHVSAMSVVVQLNIPITLILAHFFLSEKMSYWRTSGVIVSFIGVLIITLEPQVLEESAAVIVVFAATALYSVGVIVMRKITAVPVFQTQAWVSFYSVPAFIIMTLAFEENHVEQVMNLDMVGISMVLYTSVLSTIVGYGGMNFLLRRFPVTLISPFMVTVPVFATISAVIFLDEAITTKFVIGAGVTLSGLAIIHYRDWQLKRKSKVIANEGA